MRKRLLAELKAFEAKLLESSDGIDCSGSSVAVSLYHWSTEEHDVSGAVYGWLFFNGEKLVVRTESATDSWPDPDGKDYELGDVTSEWQVLLSKPEIFASLVGSMSKSLEVEHVTISTTNEWLTKLVTEEKAVIDSEIQEQFDNRPNLLESW
ncbi:hypothetical protein [Pseudomonas taiwanensis]|uniref:hypothetical protein n=1 Tax=Pseudomonas taiwanensis TaxID=470150 RepID=UPI001648B9BE|nr:hypothetical protein [Pseudomonas taiwanensis]MBC3492454.1 hypothetical protein [Pseudomonas taiwanensis]